MFSAQINTDDSCIDHFCCVMINSSCVWKKHQIKVRTFESELNYDIRLFFYSLPWAPGWWTSGTVFPPSVSSPPSVVCCFRSSPWPHTWPSVHSPVSSGLRSHSADLGSEPKSRQRINSGQEINPEQGNVSLEDKRWYCRALWNFCSITNVFTMHYVQYMSLGVS